MLVDAEVRQDLKLTQPDPCFAKCDLGGSYVRTKFGPLSDDLREITFTDSGLEFLDFVFAVPDHLPCLGDSPVQSEQEGNANLPGVGLGLHEVQMRLGKPPRPSSYEVGEEISERWTILFAILWQLAADAEHHCAEYTIPIAICEISRAGFRMDFGLNRPFRCIVAPPDQHFAGILPGSLHLDRFSS